MKYVSAACSQSISGSGSRSVLKSKMY